jgi:hypothetical protein
VHLRGCCCRLLRGLLTAAFEFVCGIAGRVHHALRICFITSIQWPAPMCQRALQEHALGLHGINNLRVYTHARLRAHDHKAASSQVHHSLPPACMAMRDSHTL